MREPGYYPVKLLRKYRKAKWEVALWNGVRWWRFMSAGRFLDYNFAEIGPRIELPGKPGSSTQQISDESKGVSKGAK